MMGWAYKEKMMKPIKRKIWVEIEYWACGNEGHRHATEEIAARCIAKSSAKKTRIPKELRRLQWIDAASAVIRGAPWKEAGVILGVSTERARQIVHKVMRMSMHPSRLKESVPDHDKWDVKQVRTHAPFWLRRMDCMRAEWTPN